MFNGYLNQYVDRPIHVQPNEKIRVWVMDDGPSDISSFHVIGTIFDSVYKEGAYLLQPNSNNGGGQALDLDPRPRVASLVEFTLPASAGVYTFITPTEARNAARLMSDPDERPLHEQAAVRADGGIAGRGAEFPLTTDIG